MPSVYGRSSIRKHLYRVQQINFEEFVSTFHRINMDRAAMRVYAVSRNTAIYNAILHLAGKHIDKME